MKGGGCGCGMKFSGGAKKVTRKSVKKGKVAKVAKVAKATRKSVKKSKRV